MNKRLHALNSLRGMTHLAIFKDNFKQPKAIKKTKKEIEKEEAEEKAANAVSNVSDIDFGDEKQNNHKSEKKKTKQKDNNVDVDYGNLKIEKIESDKNKIKQRYLMEMDVCPKHPTVVAYVGSIGSGKTTLLINLLMKPQFYGKSLEGIKGNEKKPYFDEIFMLTNSDDDMYSELIDLDILKENHIKFNPEPDDIQMIIDAQRKTIDEKGLVDSPKVLIILDDIVDNQKLMRSTPFRSLFIRPRQLSFSIWICSQYFQLLPKSLRLNAMNLFLFKQEKAGNDIICEQYQPSYLTTDKFRQLIDQATTPSEDDPNPFLHINRRVKDKTKMFRRNLDTIIIAKP